MDLISLATDFLNTPKGKLLLGEEINIAGITSRIQELSTTYNIDLEELAVSTLEEKTEAITQTKKVDKTLSAKERIKAKSSQLNEDKKNIVKKVKEEILLLKQKLVSQIPKLETYTITGRLFDQQTGNVLNGASVTLGVNTDINPTPDVNLPVDPNLISNLPNIDFPDLVYIPVPLYKTKTDEKGEFSLEIKVPIIPQNQKTPLNLGVLYSKSKYVPSGSPIINGDKTIKTNLSASSLINIDKAAESISQEYNDTIDKAQQFIENFGLTLPNKLISVRKFSIAKLVNVIKSKLIPLAVGILLAFGISKLSQANRKTCPTPEELAELIRRRNRIVRQLNQMYATITINTALAAAFLALSKSLKGIRLSMDAIPALQTIGTPPAKDWGGVVFSQPYSFTAKLQHINDELEKLEEQFDGMNRATLVALVILIAGTVTCILLLQGIDNMAQECAEESGGWILVSGSGENGPPLNPPPNPESPYTDPDGSIWTWDNNGNNVELELINQELLDLSAEQEEDGNPVIKNINGFTMAVITDDKNPVGSLKRRYAVAKNNQGIVQLKGEPSFSASDQILIDELVFYIQQNDLKAF